MFHEAEYDENITYSQSYSQVYSAEAAALINKEKGQHLLTILVGVWLKETQQESDTELQVAIESAKRAERIYPGTVTGLIFSENYIAEEFSQTEAALKQLHTARSIADNLQLKLGIRVNCLDIFETGRYPLNANRKKIYFTLIEIIKKSDFVICVVEGMQYDFSFGASTGFENVKRDLLRFRVELAKINPSIEVMGQTGYSTLVSDNNDLKNQRDYWQKVDNWANANKYTMWMFEAFDNPWKHQQNDPWGAHYGWWKLTSNSEVGNINGYIEKVSGVDSRYKNRSRSNFDDSEKPQEPMTNQGWIYAVVTIGAIVAVGVVVQVVLLYIRLNKLKKQILSKDEIKQFLYGNEEYSDKRNIQDDAVNVPEAQALSKPYNKSYEISLEKITIGI